MLSRMCLIIFKHIFSTMGNWQGFTGGVFCGILFLLLLFLMLLLDNNVQIIHEKWNASYHCLIWHFSWSKLFLTSCGVFTLSYYTNPMSLRYVLSVMGYVFFTCFLILQCEKVLLLMRIVKGKIVMHGPYLWTLSLFWTEFQIMEMFTVLSNFSHENRTEYFARIFVWTVPWARSSSNRDKNIIKFSKIMLFILILFPKSSVCV